MAKAIAQHLVKIPEFTIFAAAPSLPLGKTPEGIWTYNDNLTVVRKCSLILLAVKPGISADVLKEIGPALLPDSLLISVVAGLNLHALASHCGPHQPIVRAMPNLPIAVGLGATPLLANQWVSAQQKEVVRQLFQSGGISAWIDNEKDIDSLTALSGSGPAYLFYFLEAFFGAGIAMGLPLALVKPFVLQTITGSVQLAQTADLEPHQLQKKVTSPGGTTAAAIAVFEKHGLDKILVEAIQAAATRARELGESTR